MFDRVLSLLLGVFVVSLHGHCARRFCLCFGVVNEIGHSHCAKVEALYLGVVSLFVFVHYC